MSSNRLSWLLFPFFLLPFFFLLLALHGLLYSESFYFSQLHRLGVTETFGTDVMEVHVREVWGFFRREGTLPSFFNPKEQAHLTDVRALLTTAQYSFYGLAALFSLLLALLLMRKRYRLLALGLLGGGLLTLLVIGLVALTDFDRLFLRFHQLAFANDLWQLNPATDRLIQLFPPPFFQAFAMAVMRRAALLGLLSVLAGLALLSLLSLSLHAKSRKNTL